MLVYWRVRHFYSHCWWFRNPKQPPGMVLGWCRITLLKNGETLPISTVEFTGFLKHQESRVYNPEELVTNFRPKPFGKTSSERQDFGGEPFHTIGSLGSSTDEKTTSESKTFGTPWFRLTAGSPTAITYEKNRKWTEPNLQGIMFHANLQVVFHRVNVYHQFRGAFWSELVKPRNNEIESYWELTYPRFKGTFQDDFLFPQMRYVGSLEV